MTRMVQAVLVNPYDQSVTLVDLDADAADDGGTNSPLYELIDAPPGYLEFKMLAPELGFYCHEEGLMAMGDKQRFWRIQNFPHVLAGKALFVGLMGDRTAELPVEKMKDMRFWAALITWAPPTLRFAGFTTTQGRIKHPVFGEMDQIEQRAVFVGEGHEEWDH
jgi:hypothetical protein